LNEKGAGSPHRIFSHPIRETKRFGTERRAPRGVRHWIHCRARLRRLGGNEAEKRCEGIGRFYEDSAANRGRFGAVSKPKIRGRGGGGGGGKKKKTAIFFLRRRGGGKKGKIFFWGQGKKKKKKNKTKTLFPPPPPHPPNPRGGGGGPPGMELWSKGDYQDAKISWRV